LLPQTLPQQHVCSTRGFRFFNLHELSGLKSYAVFSSRTNFNDLFDSKIHTPRPTPRQIEDLLEISGVKGSTDSMKNWVSAGKFTPLGLAALKSFEEAFNETIDSYPIYCVSTSNNYDPLWAHYASSHTGFCIEFEFPGAQPTRVQYREQLETIPLLDFLSAFYQFGSTDPGLGNRILDALHVKLNRWASENEYRLIAGNEIGKLPKGSKFMKVPYDPTWVKAIIFGCRTSDEVKAYIKSNLSFSTEFKQAIAVKDRIELVSEV
jgi:hypothetical protein